MSDCSVPPSSSGPATAVVQGILLHPQDDVIVLLESVSDGATVFVSDVECLTTLGAISAGHKIARGALPGGAQVRKYGQPIGRLTTGVQQGEHVHTHNLVSLRAVGGLR